MALSNADKLGLPYLGWLLNHGWLTALMIAWLITPGMMIIIAPVLESRWLPLGSKQFLSFFPGDLFLGVIFAGSIALAQYLPSESGRWYQSSWWHLGVLAFVLIVAMTVSLLVDRPGMLAQAYWSPTKLYHDFGLYVCYGFVMLCIGIPALIETPWNGTALLIKTALIICFLVWAGLVGYDRLLADTSEKTPHIRDWWPLWSTGRVRSS